MSKDSFIFYRSFYEAIKELPRDIQGEIYTAIMEYGLNGNEIDNLKPIAKSLFVLIKPQIDRNLQRYENGKKGGNPNFKKGESNPYYNGEKDNQKITERYPKDNQKITERLPNVNVNVNDNVNDNVLKKNTKKKFDLDFVEKPFLKLVEDFIEYRKEIKRPFKTQRGVKTFYNELLKLSKKNIPKAKDLCDVAKGKEWLTVYEGKQQKSKVYIQETRKVERF